MLRKTPLTWALLAGLFAQTATAQVHYGGYDLGPDYGAMIQQALQRQQAMNAQMQQQAQALVAQAMQDPQCQAMYRQHLAGGGGLTFPQFAYQYVATAHFSADGMARYRETEAADQRAEAAALAGLRAAERNRADAIAAGNEHFSANQREFREVLGGNSTWSAPDGSRVSLPYLGENQPYTDRNGYVYQRDAGGRYYVRDLRGNWYPMTPAQ